jgi:hypothetical protein
VTVGHFNVAGGRDSSREANTERTWDAREKESPALERGCSLRRGWPVILEKLSLTLSARSREPSALEAEADSR